MILISYKKLFACITAFGFITSMFFLTQHVSASYDTANGAIIAQNTTGSGIGSGGGTGSGAGTPGTTGSGVGTQSPTCSGGACLTNPLDSSISSIPAFFLAILDILLVFAIPFVVFFIIYAGFMYVTAQGNPSKIQDAHMALLYALIGGVLIFGARAILDIITNTVNSVM